MSKIIEIQGRKILDSRGKTTVEVKLRTDDGHQVFDSVPSGTSTGSREDALVEPEIAIANINKIIAEKLLGQDVANQGEIDRLMISLDGTENKSKLGANAILGVSLAVARAGAQATKMPLFWHLNKLFRQVSGAQIEPRLPTPMMVMICGGKHGGNSLCIQEFLLIGTVEQGQKVWHTVEKVLKKRRVKYKLGLEGAFSPDLAYDEDALEVIEEAIQQAGFEVNRDVRLGLDVAGNNCQMSNDEVLKVFQRHQLFSLEDPFSETSWHQFGQLKLELQEIGRDFLLIGDDLFATHKALLQKGINDLVANGIIIKINQVGTVTEAMEVSSLAKKAGYKCIVSHRSGETQDTFIADFAVAIAADFLKSGAPIPRERILKYKRLKEIESEI